MEHTRHEVLLRHLKLFGQMTVQEAADLLQVSEITARRCFREMADEGVVVRLRGGIRLPQMKGTLPFSMREIEHAAVKSQIAREAARRLQPDDVLIIDGGTTTFHMHDCLPAVPLKVITNSLPIAAALEEARGTLAWPEIHLTGGVLYQQTGVLVGPGARRALGEYHARWTFLSVGGIDASGITNTTELVADVEREMIRQGETVIVLADHTKFGRSALCRVAGLDAVDLLITNRHPDSADAVTELRRKGVMIELVGYGFWFRCSLLNRSGSGLRKRLVQFVDHVTVHHGQ